MIFYTLICDEYMRYLIEEIHTIILTREVTPVILDVSVIALLFNYICNLNYTIAFILYFALSLF